MTIRLDCPVKPGNDRHPGVALFCSDEFPLRDSIFMVIRNIFCDIDFQIINFTRPEGGDNTSSISPTDNAVKLFMWKSIDL